MIFKKETQWITLFFIIYSCAANATKPSPPIDEHLLVNEVESIIPSSTSTPISSALPGVDSDADGIRDDLELYIQNTYSGSDELRIAVRNSFYNIASFYSSFLNGIAPVDGDYYLDYARKVYVPLQCLGLELGGDEAVEDAVATFKGYTFNTIARANFYMQKMDELTLTHFESEKFINRERSRGSICQKGGVWTPCPGGQKICKMYDKE